MIELISGEFGG